MDVFDHELAAYGRVVKDIKAQFYEFEKDPTKVDNLTTFGLAHSNRINLTVVGLVSLIEVCLLRVALEEGKKRSLEIKDDHFDGLVKTLRNNTIVDFDRIRNWEAFLQLRVVRNRIVHGYGGLLYFDKASKKEAGKTKLNELKESLSALDMSTSLCGERLRLTTEDLDIIFNLTSSILASLKRN